MDNSFDLMKIYGIPPAGYNEDNPDDLVLKNLPSLEQIASFNLALQTGGVQSGALPPITNLQKPDYAPTPATVYGLSDEGVSYNQNPQNNANLTNASSNVSLASSSNAMQNTAETGTELSQQITDFSNPYPITPESIQFLNGFIRTQIGRRAQIQFLVGSTDIVEKDGFILGVGSNYILINEIGSNDITACDFYNIKFIRFLY